ncbi:MAG: ribonuclease H-like domain-containing protein [Chitinophagales bacterium]|nr:ribonuclease H-like domain-containing protein [Chitinophagales bacterium]MCZ2394388.1 ribonuclease H-like domain-containing protein [Chitinophagales bacterium]
MLDHIPLSKVLFIDIETVSGVSDLSDLPEYDQELWAGKRGKFKPEDLDEDEYYFNNAGIFAEFGKIICISMGYFSSQQQETIFRVKSIYGDDEKSLLSQFIQVFKKIEQSFGNQMIVCGHNVKEFDIPYICRRLLVHQLIDEFPIFLQKIQFSKPWELSAMVLDTLDVWRFGDYKNYISLKLLTHVLGIPTPKDDIDGSEVARVYYHEYGLERIRKYCEKDVVAVARIVSKIKGMKDLQDSEVMSI